jgi:hypothetical protein
MTQAFAFGSAVGRWRFGKRVNPLQFSGGNTGDVQDGQQSRWSLDDIIIPVSLLIPQGANPDPSLDVVEFQLVLGGLPARAQPKDDAWVAGFWINPPTTPLLACISCGPGGSLTPAEGRWAIWIKVHDNPTVPVVAVDQIIIT